MLGTHNFLLKCHTWHHSQGQEANHSILCHHRQVKEFAMKCWQCGSLTRVTSTFTEESVKIRYRVCTGCGEKMRSFEEVERDHHVAQRLTQRVLPAPINGIALCPDCGAKPAQTSKAKCRTGSRRYYKCSDCAAQFCYACPTSDPIGLAMRSTAQSDRIHCRKCDNIAWSRGKAKTFEKFKCTACEHRFKIPIDADGRRQAQTEFIEQPIGHRTMP